MARLVRRVLRPRGASGDRRSGGLGARRHGPAVGVGAVACSRRRCDAPSATSRRERLDRAMARGRARRALRPGARTHAGGRRPRTRRAGAGERLAARGARAARRRASMLGDDDLADATMAEAAEQAESIGVVPSRIVALSQRSLLAAGRGDEARAAELALEARQLVDDHDLEATSAARSRSRCRPGGRRTAGISSALAPSWSALVPSVPQLSRALPWYSVQAAFELAQVCHLDPGDVAGARMWLALADSILRPAAPASASSSPGGSSSRRTSTASPAPRTAESRRSPPPSCACSRF